jgi:2-polyprenyl-3-methyl-5-hydroxy-6-metoxy-1,4-benzoquinol methylase
MKQKYEKKKSSGKWEEYYHKKNFVARLIDVFITGYFSKVFERDLKHIIGIKRGKILEPGCGSGIMSARLAKSGYDITVMDLSKNALNTAKVNFGKIGAKGYFVEGDIFKMPFKKESFDVVWNQGVIEHFDDVPLVVKKMNALVKNSGYLILYVPAHNSPLHLVYRILSALNLKRLWPFDDQIFFRKEELKAVMLKAGIKDPVVRSVPWNFFFSVVGYAKKR